MAFNRASEENLLRIKNNFSSIARKIFEEIHLKPTDDSEGGAKHATRIAILIRMLFNFLQIQNYDVYKPTESQITVLQLAALFYDCERNNDYSRNTKKSMQLFADFLKKEGITDKRALGLCQSFADQEKTLAYQLLQGAVSLDLMRHVTEYDLKKNPFFLPLQPKDRKIFLDFVIGIQKWLASQSDLHQPCSIILDNEIVSPSIKNQKMPTYKEYDESEHDPDLFAKMAAELSSHSILKRYFSSPDSTPLPAPAQAESSVLLLHLASTTLYNNRYIFTFDDQNEALECLANIKKLIEQETPDVKDAHVVNSKKTTYKFYLFKAQLEALRLAIRNAAPSIKPAGDYFYKSLTAQPYCCYFHRFVEELSTGKKFPKRIGNQKNVTTTGSGVYLRYPDLDSDQPFKTPQYTPDEKDGFTNFQSTSIGMEDFFPKVFSWNKNGCLAGVMLDEKNVLLSDRLFIYDSGTVCRPYDSKHIHEGQSYFNENHQKILFSKQEFEAYKEKVRKKPNIYSEPLVRLKWLFDGTCKIFIGADNLGSRLLAKQYADTLLLELKKTNKCPPHYQIPICYYIPEKPKLLFKEYTREEHYLDRLEAIQLLHDRDHRLNEYENKHFEFLLALPPDLIHEVLLEKTSDDDGLPLAIYLLKYGYEHIYRFLLEKTNFDLKSTLNHLPNCVTYAKEILPHAIRSGDLSLVTTLLQYDLNMKEKKFSELVFSALERQLPEIAYSLISSKHFIHVPAKDRNQALVLAARLGDIKLVELLLREGAEVDSRREGDLNETPLMLAAYYGHTHIVELLLANGAKIDIKNNNSYTALTIAVYRGQTKVAEQLLFHHARVNHRDHSLNTPLHIATYCGNKDMVNLLLQNHADINKVNLKGETILHIAAAKGMTDIVDLLKKKDVILNSKDNNGYTPLHRAILHDCSKIAALLIKNGADIHTKSKYGTTPIITTVDKQQLNTFNLLLAKGAEVNDKNFTQNTLLHYAAKWGKKRIVKLLLQKGADVQDKNNNGNTPLHIAALWGKTKIISVLLENHANIDEQNEVGNTPLMTAALVGEQDAVQTLITSGADLEVKNKENKTALDIATGRNKGKIIEFIKIYRGIQELWQQAAIESTEENAIAYQLSRLFHQYAKFNIFRHHRGLATKISDELEKNSLWTLSECIDYIETQVKNIRISPNGTFAGLLNLIKTLEIKTLTHQIVPSVTSLLETQPAVTHIHGFLGKSWTNIHTEELYKLLDWLAKPYVRITNADLDKIKSLVKKGALLTQTIHGKTIAACAVDVHINAWFSNDWKCVKAIIDATLEINHPEKLNMFNFLLEKAILAGQKQIAEYLLQNGLVFKDSYVTISKKKNDHEMLELLAKYNPNSPISVTTANTHTTNSKNPGFFSIFSSCWKTSCTIQNKNSIVNIESKSNFNL